MNTNPASQLDHFLEVTLPRLASREKETFDSFIDATHPHVVVYGCGNLGKKLLKGMSSRGIVPAGCADGSPKIWGTQLDGMTVLSPEEAAAKWGKNAVFVIAVCSPGEDRQFPRLRRFLEGLGCDRVVSFLPLAWKLLPEINVMPHLGLDLPSRMLSQKSRIRAAFSLLADDESRQEYAWRLEWLVNPEAPAIPLGHPLAETYFAPDLAVLQDNERFVDCGAYDGDTLRALLQKSGSRLKAYVGFEPDPANFAALQTQTRNLPSGLAACSAVHASAISEKAGTMRFAADGWEGSALNTTGNIEVSLVSLDDALGDFSPTYIKFDIEGAELHALKGAINTIRRHLPLLAVSAYHIQNHLWEIPLLVETLCPGNYKFHLRRYEIDMLYYAIPSSPNRPGEAL